MFAAALSGGGNYGALQAGALEVLLEAGWKPSLWVGTSAGGLNAIIMASNPTVEGARTLQELWRKARPVPPAHTGLFTVARQFALGKDSFFPNEPVLEYVARNIPEGIETFGSLFEKNRNRALTVAVEYPTGHTRVFGENPEDMLVDGAMASSALVPFFPPWHIGRKSYIDGAFAANLPVRVAVEYGAHSVLALRAHGPMATVQGSGLIDIIDFALDTMIDCQTESQLEWSRHEGARVYFLQIEAGPVKGWDFSQADVLIEIGRKAARQYLKEHGKRKLEGPTFRWMLRRLFRRGPQIRKW